MIANEDIAFVLFPNLTKSNMVASDVSVLTSLWTQDRSSTYALHFLLVKSAWAPQLKPCQMCRMIGARKGISERIVYALYSTFACRRRA